MRLRTAEWRVMHALWAHGPATEDEVRAALDRGSQEVPDLDAVLARLVERGALAARRAGSKNRYLPLLSPDEARGSAVRRLCDDAFGGAAAGLLEFLLAAEDVPAGDRAAMARLLAQRAARDGEGSR